MPVTDRANVAAVALTRVSTSDLGAGSILKK